jgi:hypothetical protein
MPQSGQEHTARRFQSFDTALDSENASPRSRDDYECELPPEVRAELNRPKRPRILGGAKRATLDPAVKGRLYLVIIVAALVLGGTALGPWRQWDAERAQDRKAISHPLAPQPAPVPTVNPWRAQLALHPEQFPYANAAPRAALVKLPPPRAQLVRLPEWRVGETRPVLMPYNLEVSATYGGQLDQRACCIDKDARPRASGHTPT